MLNKSKGLLVVISAPSGCGKTTIKNQLMESGLYAFSISYTTREKRSNEVDGADYCFISEEEFHEKIKKNEFLEYAEVHGAYYGTGMESLEALESGKHVLLDIDIQGEAQVKGRVPDCVSIFILPPSWSILKGRLQSRKTESVEDIEQRLQNAKEELRHYNQYDYCIVNDQLAQALIDIQSIVAAEQCQTKRWEVNIDDFYKS